MLMHIFIRVSLWRVSSVQAAPNLPLLYPPFRYPQIPLDGFHFKALADLSNRFLPAASPRDPRMPRPLYFTQEDVDNVLYGYSRAAAGPRLSAHALSGLKAGEITHGVWKLFMNCCLILPIASKQLNGLTTNDTVSWLGGAVLTHPLWV